MDQYEKIERRNKRNAFWGDILGGAFIIISIMTGTAMVIAPLIIVAWLWMNLSGKG